MTTARHERRMGRLEISGEPADERQRLVLENIDIAMAELRRIVVGDPEESRAVALEAMCFAASRYDPGRRATFRTYAGQVVRGRLLNHVNRYVLRRCPRNTSSPLHCWEANQTDSFSEIDEEVTA